MVIILLKFDFHFNIFKTAFPYVIGTYQMKQTKPYS
jgi:hypothetical protein